MEKALEIIRIQTAYAITEDTEKPGETIETDFRQFRYSWYKSERWITDYQAPLPPSASRHLLIAAQEELCPEVDFAHMEVVTKQFLAGLHLEDVLPGVPGYVFVIHGRDEVSLARLAALIERRGFTPIILGRQSVRGGKTVIEDLEDTLPQADLVVALLTPDDEGRLRGSANPLRPRARQNVLVEAGYALIHRRQDSIVVALGGVEIPSDFEGIRRIQAETWDFNVEQQLIEALNTW